MNEEPELPKTEPARYKLESQGVVLELYWDGFCFTVECGKYAFVASVNDPTISDQGNVSIIFGAPDEIAQRIST